MADSKTKSDKNPVQWSGQSSRYVSDDIVERYSSSEDDKDRKSIAQEVYDRLSSDADAELATMSALGADMEKVYADTALSVDQFIEQLIHGNEIK